MGRAQLRQMRERIAALEEADVRQRDRIRELEDAGEGAADQRGVEPGPGA